MIVLVVLLLIATTMILSMVFYKIFLEREKKILVPIGKMIRIGDNNFHVYSQGEFSNEKPTIVILSG